MIVTKTAVIMTSTIMFSFGFLLLLLKPWTVLFILLEIII